MLMQRVYVIGDIHTLSAFRLAGVEGVVAGAAEAGSHLREIAAREDGAVVIITREVAEGNEEAIREINERSLLPVVVEIPGIMDPRGFDTSALRSVIEALGVSI